MGWLFEFFARRSADRLARRSAKALFRETYPHLRGGRPRVVERNGNAEDVVVAIVYSAGCKPMPMRFFRVVGAGTVSKCPRDFWPRGWGPHM
jgi:hypothetical protein